ncbi:unnamed protein product [Arctogadus glacialis]
MEPHLFLASASFSLWAMDKMLGSQQQLCRLLPAVPSRPLLLSPSTSSLLTPSLSPSPMLTTPILQLPPDPFSSAHAQAPSRPLLLSPSPRLTAGLQAVVPYQPLFLTPSTSSLPTPSPQPVPQAHRGPAGLGGGGQQGR